MVPGLGSWPSDVVEKEASQRKRFSVCCEWLEGWSRAYFLVFVLELVELVVEAALGEELLVGAALAQGAFVHDEDGVGGLDRAEAVGDQDAGAACDHAREGEADAVFGLGVDRAGGLVEDEDRWRVGEGAGEGDELLLAGGEGGSAFEDRLLELVGQGADEVGYVDLFGGVFEASSVIQLEPRRMLSAMVPVKRNGSWRTTPKRRRSAVRSWSRTSTPSMRIWPCWMS